MRGHRKPGKDKEDKAFWAGFRSMWPWLLFAAMFLLMAVCFRLFGGTT